MQHFNVFVFNSTAEGYSKAEVEKTLVKVLRLKEEQAKRIMSRERTLIKKNVPQAQLSKYKAALKKCGISFKIVPVDSADKTEVGQQKTVSPIADKPLIENVERQEEKPLSANKIQEESSPAGQNVYQSPASTNLEKVFCRSCGSAMGPLDRACPSCGQKVNLAGRSKVAAGFLAFFLGWLGIHRFYLRQWWGVIYIPFGLVGISGIFAIFEAIYFWCCSQASWDNKYGHLPPARALTLVLVALVPAVMVVGILAAVALPAYQDYTHRASIYPGIAQLERTSDEVGKFILRTDYLPGSKLEAGLQDLSPDNEALSAIDIIEGGQIVGTFAPLIPQGESYTIIFTPERSKTKVSWSCGAGTMPNKYRPSKCRASASSNPIATQNKTLKKYIQSSESKARIKVPSSWRENVAENEDASINAGNPFRESYVVVIEDDFNLAANAYTLENYAEEMAAYYLDVFDQASLLSSSSVYAGELSGYRYDILAKVEGYDVNYLLAFYATSDRTYQILTWSMSSSFDRNKHDLIDVLESLELE